MIHIYRNHANATQVKREAAKEMEHSLTCYAWREADQWEAICVDFDIAAEGRTLEDATQQLSDAVISFLDNVNDLPEVDRRILCARKSPRLLRWRLAVACKVWTWWRALSIGQSDGYTTVDLPERQIA